MDLSSKAVGSNYLKLKSAYRFRALWVQVNSYESPMVNWCSLDFRWVFVGLSLNTCGSEYI